MSLLDDFKTATGATESDQYLIDYFLKPSIDKASELSSNKYEVTITLTSGTSSYDLTDSSVCSPVVPAAGVQTVIVQESDLQSYILGTDYYVQGLTTLYFPSSDIVPGGSYDLVYNRFYSKPTTDPTETDMPTYLFPSVIRHSRALYRLDQLGAGASASGGVRAGAVKLREANLEVDYGTNSQSRISLLQGELLDAEKEMLSLGGASNFFSIKRI